MQNMLIAFLLNLIFAIGELIGGIFTNSVAITSDAIHDFGDALSIGAAYIMEKRSHKKGDKHYTFGYARWSVLSAAITSLILVVGSVIVIVSAVMRLINPQPINRDGMLIIAVIGTVINLIAALLTRHGDTLNKKAINLHMLEDMFGWITVLIGAIIIKFTNMEIIDPLMSIAIALFILFSAAGNLFSALGILLDKAPKKIKTERVKKQLLKIKGVEEIHAFRLWQLDETNIMCTLHVVINPKKFEGKHVIREHLHSLGIKHTTIEIETEDTLCGEDDEIKVAVDTHHHHHHGHSHEHGEPHEHNHEHCEHEHEEHDHDCEEHHEEECEHDHEHEHEKKDESKDEKPERKKGKYASKNVIV